MNKYKTNTVKMPQALARIRIINNNNKFTEPQHEYISTLNLTDAVSRMAWSLVRDLRNDIGCWFLDCHPLRRGRSKKQGSASYPRRKAPPWPHVSSSWMLAAALRALVLASASCTLGSPSSTRVAAPSPLLPRPPGRSPLLPFENLTGRSLVPWWLY